MHYNFGNLLFKGNANTMFSNNTANYYGGAIGIFDHVNIFLVEILSQHS